MGARSHNTYTRHKLYPRSQTRKVDKTWHDPILLMHIMPNFNSRISRQKAVCFDQNYLSLRREKKVGKV